MTISQLTLTLTTAYQRWERFWRLYHLYQHRDRLTDLIHWAERKPLKGVATAYRSQRDDVEIRIAHAEWQQRNVRDVAHCLYQVNRLFQHKPRYYARGSAAHYRRTVFYAA